MILIGNSAKNFIKKANESLKNRSQLDISEQIKITKSIIKKSQLVC